jgi:Tfp pilus assembly protein PilN
MRAVNLLPDTRGSSWRSSPRNQLRAVTAGAGTFLLLIGLLLVVVVVHGNRAADDKRNSLRALEAELAQAQAATAASAARRAQTEARFAAFTVAASGRVQWSTLLDDLSRFLPRGAWFTTLTAQAPALVGAAADPAAAAATAAAPAPAVGAVPTAFTVTGQATSQAVVARSLERLALMPMLSEVTLQSSVRADIGNRAVYQFTIAANVRSSGGTP